ncbi:MAG: hypothetical protein LBF94_03825, partial [Puniceicoccales bacterium]|nr:hypothetical protein [Puniceicoccales bacterium]
MENIIDISGLTAVQQQEFRNWYSERKRENVQRGQNVLRDAGVAYLDPTFDRTFKWLMGSDNPNIARTIFDSMVFLTYKGLVT